jgi:hypothetical protein
MWSPPRTISTALMRSWGNRPDTFVCDEPLYAYFLRSTGLPHPMAEDIIARHDNDWRSVVAWLTGPVPEGRAIFYQKHMAHHFLPEIDRDWLDRVTNCFLIRDPREMLPSYVKKNDMPRLEDTGYPQILDIFEHVRSRTGTVPPVIDSRDVLQSPRRTLESLCAALSVEFTEKMLSWPPGPRDTDGVWAEHWYGEVLATTSFQPYRPKSDPIPAELGEVYAKCDAIYRQLYEHRLK